MKLMIASDIHGSAYYCRKLLEAYDREKAGRMVILGDILYHGPRNDLPKEYAPKEVIAMLNPRKKDLLCVRGNCDTEVDQMVLEFPILADYGFLYEKGRMIFLTHGHVFNEKNLPMAGKYMPVRELKIILNLPLPLLTMTEIHVLYCVMFLLKVRQ